MKLPATLTLKEAGAVAGSLEQEIGRMPPGSELNLDAADLQNFDTGAIAVVLQGMRAAAGRNVQLSLKAVPEKLSRLAALYGVSELLQRPGPVHGHPQGPAPVSPPPANP